jgi:hypothetical protein
MSNRKSYHKQYYRKQAMDGLRNTIKTLRTQIKTFEESEEGVAYKKRKQQEYSRAYRIANQESIRQYQKEYHEKY